ncbi:helix-turn-helix domain-containing protein [Burkholderia glumae]|uniref:helix-turn-helix domain-containing protein n=1 Tax=Burkholderia glumae TaxID=337 RepID=UPI0002EF953C|nr:transcriptional regulator [Burkholderia glumae]PJO24277.1 transcriptional regulator [Burkholderia glumae AU6208]QHE11534.1 helix-turn-helix domain-containing protein [Burkholderia glumae AU6208]
MKGDGVGEELAKRVGSSIAKQRKAAGYTQIRVADALGLEKETVSRIENGVIAPTLFRLAQFADLFNCPVSALFGEYRGKALEDTAEIAHLVADLPEEARRAALRMLAEFVAVARDREEQKRQAEAWQIRFGELEREYLSLVVDKDLPEGITRRPRIKF